MCFNWLKTGLVSNYWRLDLDFFPMTSELTRLSSKWLRTWHPLSSNNPRLHSDLFRIWVGIHVFKKDMIPEMDLPQQKCPGSDGASPTVPVEVVAICKGKERSSCCYYYFFFSCFVWSKLTEGVPLKTHKYWRGSHLSDTKSRAPLQPCVALQVWWDTLQWSWPQQTLG